MRPNPNYPSLIPKSPENTPRRILSELLCFEQPSDEPLTPSPGSDYESEYSQSEVPSYFDPAILGDERVLRNLSTLEGYQEGRTRDYFEGAPGSEIQPFMRKIVACWMLEVCEEQKCEEPIFPLSIALLDTFLGSTEVKKSHFQLAASACLLIASKSRQCHHFDVDLLAFYTDNSVTSDSIKAWELMILSQIGWDVNLVTALDFADLFLARCTDLDNGHCTRKNVINYIGLCATEPSFVGVKPSIVAAASIYAVHMRSLPQKQGSDLLDGLTELANTSKEQVRGTAEGIERIVHIELAAKASKAVFKGKVGSSEKVCNGNYSPTDVQDVMI